MAKFAGRITRSDDSRYGPISRRRQAWFPSVSTSAPAASSFSASFGVIPDPSATFSPFTMQKSAPSSSLSPGRRSSTACRPGAPKTSAMKRMFSYGKDRVAAGWAVTATWLPASVVYFASA